MLKLVVGDGIREAAFLGACWGQMFEVRTSLRQRDCQLRKLNIHIKEGRLTI